MHCLKIDQFVENFFLYHILWKIIVFPGEWRTAWNGRFATENTRKLEAVFRSGIFPVDADNFQCFPRGSFRKSSEKIRAGILLPCSRYLPCFPAGSSDFPARSCEIRWQEWSTWVALIFHEESCSRILFSTHWKVGYFHQKCSRNSKWWSKLLVLIGNVVWSVRYLLVKKEKFYLLFLLRKSKNIGVSGHFLDWV